MATVVAGRVNFRGILTSMTTYLMLRRILFETLHHIARKAHIIEHSLQFLSERVAAVGAKIQCATHGFRRVCTHDSTLSLATMFRSASSDTLRPLSRRLAR
jgi:hypothetical protein